jgi:FkbM family methyltransferase
MSKVLIKKLAKKMGYVISAYDPKRDTRAIKKSLFETLGISLVLDVGANAGYYAQDLRRAGYQGKIVSFEPLSSAYKVMEEAAALDPKWTTCNCALGETDGTSEIFISSNSWSSSLLGILPEHTNAAPDSQYVAKEVITINSLDSIFDQYASADDKVFLKIDTQGYTKPVLDGASNSLDKISGVFVEMSLVPLYAGESLIGEVISMLYERGFVLLAIEPEFIDKKSGRLLQVNGLFTRA